MGVVQEEREEPSEEEYRRGSVVGGLQFSFGRVAVVGTFDIAVFVA